MATNLEKLRGLLAELFQLDQADLDFGIYRIMNSKRDEILRFLDKDLLPQVQAAFAQYKDSGAASIAAELSALEQRLKDDGVDPSQSKKYQELAAKHEAARKAGLTDAGSLEQEVFSDLYNFFRRYYSEGDFLSLRRYKAGVYAVPYEGEEVYLHWANKDQYYIKTSEYLRDYAFKLPDGRRVHFKLVEANTETDNKKEQAGQERRFILDADEPMVEEGGELFIRFHYKPVSGEKKKQADLNAKAVNAVLKSKQHGSWTLGLGKTDPTPSNPNRTLLERHLTAYTARNTFDYFIHKDLGGFLRRELDFFIKNEVMHLDDIESDTAPRVEQYLSKIKVLRSIASKAIAFLEQLERFQRRLWLKTRFVTETHYCVSLSLVPTALLPEIACNAAQIREWESLCNIASIARDLHQPGFSRPLTPAFLSAHHHLVVDTRHFSDDFKIRLTESLGMSGTPLSGVVIRGDNHDALRLIRRSYASSIGWAFIDPPYNTGLDDFPYKDSYQHSSWLSMLTDRLEALRPLLGPEALFFCTIDYVEVSRLRLLCDLVFGSDNFLADIAWEKRYTRSNNAKRFYSLKDTVLCYRASESLDIVREVRSDKSKENYTNPDNDPRGAWISSSYVNPATKQERPNLTYPIINPFTKKNVTHPTHAWKYDPDTHSQHVTDKRLYWGDDGSYEYPRLKSFLSEAKDGMVPIDVWHYKDTGTTDDGGNVLKDMFGREVFRNPKPPSLMQRALQLVKPTDKPLICIDFFAGSGSTAHAVLLQSKLDGIPRHFVAVDVGDHCDTVLVNRIKKLAYTTEWHEGQPVGGNGLDIYFKYCRLESYDECLANLVPRQSSTQQGLLDANHAMREDYTLRYMLDVESSHSLFRVEQFSDPYAYSLKVHRGGDFRDVPVDLVETFNWLLGLTVKSVQLVRNIRVVEGTNPSGQRVLVLWRKLVGDGAVDNEALNKWFEKSQYSTKDREFDVIYVNGDNHLENIRTSPEHIEAVWKVRLIEEEFQRLMFEDCD